MRSLPFRGQFDVARAKALGVKPGPDFGKLTNGQSVQNANGETITPEQVVGADRPGQGVAILDIPSVAYVESILQREELSSPEVMTGIGAIVWMLGPGVAGHPTLVEFMNKMDGVEHVISSLDTAPNRIANDSVACSTTLLYHKIVCIGLVRQQYRCCPKEPSPLTGACPLHSCRSLS